MMIKEGRFIAFESTWSQLLWFLFKLLDCFLAFLFFSLDPDQCKMPFNQSLPSRDLTLLIFYKRTPLAQLRKPSTAPVDFSFPHKALRRRKSTARPCPPSSPLYSNFPRFFFCFFSTSSSGVYVSDIMPLIVHRFQQKKVVTELQLFVRLLDLLHLLSCFHEALKVSRPFG